MYLMVIIGWYSRRVLAWRVSNTLETDACVEALEEALLCYGAPEIFNTDPGRPIHWGGIHSATQRPWGEDQYGWQRPLGRHCGGRTAAMFVKIVVVFPMLLSLACYH